MKITIYLIQISLIICTQDIIIHNVTLSPKVLKKTKNQYQSYEFDHIDSVYHTQMIPSIDNPPCELVHPRMQILESNMHLIIPVYSSNTITSIANLDNLIYITTTNNELITLWLTNDYEQKNQVQEIEQYQQRTIIIGGLNLDLDLSNNNHLLLSMNQKYKVFYIINENFILWGSIQNQKLSKVEGYVARSNIRQCESEQNFLFVSSDQGVDIYNLEIEFFENQNNYLESNNTSQIQTVEIKLIKNSQTSHINQDIYYFKPDLIEQKLYILNEKTGLYSIDLFGKYKSNDYLIFITEGQKFIKQNLTIWILTKSNKIYEYINFMVNEIFIVDQESIQDFHFMGQYGIISSQNFVQTRLHSIPASLDQKNHNQKFALNNSKIFQITHDKMIFASDKFIQIWYFEINNLKFECQQSMITDRIQYQIQIHSLVCEYIEYIQQYKACKTTIMIEMHLNEQLLDDRNETVMVIFGFVLGIIASMIFVMVIYYLKKFDKNTYVAKNKLNNVKRNPQYSVLGQDDKQSIKSNIEIGNITQQIEENQYQYQIVD